MVHMLIHMHADIIIMMCGKFVWEPLMLAELIIVQYQICGTCCVYVRVEGEIRISPLSDLS